MAGNSANDSIQTGEYRVGNNLLKKFNPKTFVGTFEMVGPWQIHTSHSDSWLELIQMLLESHESFNQCENNKMNFPKKKFSSFAGDGGVVKRFHIVTIIEMFELQFGVLTLRSATSKGIF